MRLGKGRPRSTLSTDELGLFAFEKFANMVNYINANLSEQVKSQIGRTFIASLRSNIKTGRAKYGRFYSVLSLFVDEADHLVTGAASSLEVDMSDVAPDHREKLRLYAECFIDAATLLQKCGT